MAVDSDDIIQVKVPASHGIFLKRNDSLVVHFKKPENADKVQAILAQWEQINGITEEPREMDRVKVAADPKGTSFSDAVAAGIAEWIRRGHETGKIDDERLIDSGIRYAIEQSQRPPKVEK